VSAFNGGTAIGTWLGGIALESSLGVLGPVVVGVAMAALGLAALLVMAARPLTGVME
jgi:DHA1 family inner membrane transport protein